MRETPARECGSSCRRLSPPRFLLFRGLPALARGAQRRQRRQRRRRRNSSRPSTHRCSLRLSQGKLKLAERIAVAAGEKACRLKHTCDRESACVNECMCVCVYTRLPPSLFSVARQTCKLQTTGNELPLAFLLFFFLSTKMQPENRASRPRIHVTSSGT